MDEISFVPARAVAGGRVDGGIGDVWSVSSELMVVVLAIVAVEILETSS